MTSDVLIVGAGPAGSVTALLLARAGLDVRLLERSAFPRSKPCGDCLSPAANSILQRLGVWDDVIATQPAQLTGWKLTSHNRESFAANFADVTSKAAGQVALAVERTHFDGVLLRAAVAAGAEVLHGVQVTDLLRNREEVGGVIARNRGEVVQYRAKLVVGADGLRSVVARRLRAYTRRPRLRKASFTVHADLDTRHSFGEMRLADDACLGIAPVAAGSARHNLTLVLHDGSFDKRSGPARIMRNGLALFGINLDNVAANDVLACGPFDWPVGHAAFPGAALVGDAAGYYDPFTGQGIFQALAGAELLAKYAAAAVCTNTVHRFAQSGYTEALSQLTRPARRIQRIIDFVCARGSLCDYAFAKFARDDFLARSLIAVTGDLASPHSLFSPRFLTRLALA
jgi:menaquinone-9 beta-reductase